MLINEISIRGFKSYGNNEQILKLNTEKGELILAVGRNGSGKSVVQNTEIEVEIDINNIEIEDFITFFGTEDKNIIENGYMKLNMNLIDLKKLQDKISIIDKKLIKVKSKDGYKLIKAIGITSPNSNKISIKTADFQLIGSPEHRVKFEEKWFFLKDLKKGDLISTVNGNQIILSKIEDNNPEDLWDIEVEGEEYYTNGILSHNSSLLESVEYCLYGKVRSGKSKKWSKLSTLPNRINNEMLNKIKFISNNTKVEIKRGISPNVLELWENDVLNEKAGKSNIDEKIEKYIDMDIETFKSFISMSINDFKNFISLSNEEKQLLLDKLFNLEVINILNGILKDIVKNNKNKAISFDSEIKALEDSINSIKRSIDKAIEREKIEAQIALKREKEDIQSEIDKLINGINNRKEEYKNLKDKIDKIKDKESELSDELDKEKKQFIICQNDIKNVQKEIDLYDSGKCPTCKTDFNTDYFLNLRETLIQKKEKFENVKDEIESNINKIKDKQIKLKTLSESTNKLFNDLNYLLKANKAEIDKLNQKKESQNIPVNITPSINIQEFEKTIEELEEKKKVSNDNISICKEKDLYYKELNRIFGEDGVKKSIISGIIKPINHFISENINRMSLNFEVTLDETFTAEIRQLGSIVEHDSLSTGEQKLTNISILIAYLKLIRTKKHINILFLDEVFSSVDIENIQRILSLLKSFANEYNINIFVVHHAVLNEEMFDRILKIEKNVFSSITEIEMNN